MPEDEGHSGCKCSQNMDFFEQILNGKNPLEEFLKKEIVKLLPDDLKNFVKLFDVKYDDNSKQSEMNFLAKDNIRRENRIGNDMIINTKIMNDYSNTVITRNVNLDYTSTDHHKMDVNAGKTMTYNYTCRNYKNTLTIDNKKYFMKEVEYKDGTKGFGYVLDVDDIGETVTGTVTGASVNEFASADASGAGSGVGTSVFDGSVTVGTVTGSDAGASVTGNGTAYVPCSGYGIADVAASSYGNDTEFVQGAH